MSTNPIEFPRFNQLNVEVGRLDEERAVVRCDGKIISDTADELSRAVKQLLGKCKHIVLDLQEVQEMDSYGLGALIALKASAARVSLSSIELCSASPRVMELLRMTNTLSAFVPAGEELEHVSVLERRREVEFDDIRRNPDTRFREVD